MAANNLTVRLTVSPWLARFRFPLALALAFGGRAGERLLSWAVRNAVKVEGPIK